MNIVPNDIRENQPSRLLMSAVPQPEERGPSLLDVIFRRKWQILIFACVATLLMALYVYHVPPRYSSSASILFDPRQVRLIGNEQIITGQALDEMQIHSTVEVFSSRKLAEAVVKKLDLNKRPEFCEQSPSLFQTINHWIGGYFGHVAAPEPSGPCEVSIAKAARQLIESVSARDEGKSYVIRLQVESNDPQLAADIANAYARVFIEDRFEQHRELTEKAREWLINYIDRLGRQTAQADAAVAEYRGRHHLTPLRGETLVSQNLSDVNTQLTTLDNEIAQKQSSLNQLMNVIKTNGEMSAIAPLVNSSTINAPLLRSLLEKESILASKDAELRTQYGSAHPKVVATAALLSQMHRQIMTEFSKNVDGLKQEITALAARRALLSTQLTNLQSRVGQQGDEDVHLQELLRAAETSRHVYQNALTRLKEIEMEQGVWRPDSQLVTEAVPAPFPFYPRKSLMIAGAFLASLCVGSGVAFGLSLQQRSFRHAKHIETETGLPMLGVFALPPAHIRPQDVTIDAPLSLEAECLQKILVNILRARSEGAGGGKIVMVTSALPGEGKTSFSVALGRAAAQAGLSTVLVDCDLRRPTVLQKLRGYLGGPTAFLPVTREMGDSEADYQHAVVTDRDSTLKIIPLARNDTASPHVIIGAPALKQMLQGLRRSFDLVLIDTPPLLAASDGLPLSYLVDELVFLIDWQTTPRDAVGEAIEILRRHEAPIAGIVLGKVDLEKYTKVAGTSSYARSYYHYGHSNQQTETKTRSSEWLN